MAFTLQQLVATTNLLQIASGEDDGGDNDACIPG
jgi:hypothetical protein